MDFFFFSGKPNRTELQTTHIQLLDYFRVLLCELRIYFDLTRADV